MKCGAFFHLYHQYCRRLPSSSTLFYTNSFSNTRGKKPDQRQPGHSSQSLWLNFGCKFSWCSDWNNPAQISPVRFTANCSAMNNLTWNDELQPSALNTTGSSTAMILPGVSSFVAGFCAIGLFSCLPAHLICRYISSKPVGMQRLADLIYSDVSR